MLKLNIGAGATEIDGFEPVDRRHGKEAYPLAYESNSVDEIRASHILEHFGHREAQDVVREWSRVLKPGGKMRIAVPDFDKITKDFRDDPKFEGYIFGGQTDENDFHKSMWNGRRLANVMANAGLSRIQPWESQNTDCASLPVSLNLEGIKEQPSEQAVDIKTCAVMTLPRYGSLAARGIIDKAFGANGIPIHTTQGVFWGQCLQRMMEDIVDDGVDIVITVDFDSVMTEKQVAQLLLTICRRNDIDCLAAMQNKRNQDVPLMTCGDKTSMETDGGLFWVRTAHFGLTAIRAEVLKKLPKPWFLDSPDANGSWREGRTDQDIHFWKEWQKAGNNVAIDPQIRIGHVEETVAYHDENLQVQRCSVPEWRDLFIGKAGPGEIPTGE